MDHRRKFIDVYIGHCGSTHDARVLQNSPFYRKAEELCGDGFLLGDAAYPLTSWLLPPYKDFGNLPIWKKNFNYVHSSGRMVIEHAFGILKQRFPRLRYITLKRMYDICLLIMSCCVLHNLCNDKDDLPNDVDPNAIEGNMEEIATIYNDRNNTSIRRELELHRDEIAHSLKYF